MRRFYAISLLLTFGGILDTAYLTYHHYSHSFVACVTGLPFLDCGKVLNSPYSMFLGAPVSVYGLIYYLCLAFIILKLITRHYIFAQRLAFIFSFLGSVLSLYFIFLQIYIIKAICVYCLTSATISICIFLIIYFYAFRVKDYTTQWINIII